MKHTGIFGLFYLFVNFGVISSASLAGTQPCPTDTGLWVDCLDLKVANSKHDIKVHSKIVRAERGLSETPIYLLAGGPGQASTEVFLPLPPAFDQLNRRHDIILVDQRGTGQSTPLECPQETDDFIKRLTHDYAIKHLKNCRQHLEASYDLSVFSTDESAEDLERVRKALGHQKIVLYGGSYGTRLALRYAKKFPGRVEAMILEGVAGLELNIMQSHHHMLRSLTEINQRCAADKPCHSQYGDLIENYEAANRRLTDELQTEIFLPAEARHRTFALTQETFHRALFAHLYSVMDIAILPAALHAAAQGDFRAILSSLANHKFSIYEALHINIVCSEDVATWRQEAGLTVAPLVEYCKLWPTYRVAEDFREPSKFDAPVLLLSGSFDPVTPPEIAARLAKALPNARHVTLKAFSHSVQSLPCIRDLMVTFIGGNYQSEPTCPDDEFLSFLVKGNVTDD